MARKVPGVVCKVPEARVDAAVIVLNTEHVQFHIPLVPKAD